MRLAPDVQIPQTLQFSVGLDHQLRKTTTLSITYTGARGYHLFRSRDVNAPTAAVVPARGPIPSYGVVRQIESTGRQETDSLQVTLRGRVTRWFNGQMQYTLSRADNDTNGINCVSGERLRPVGRMGARGFRPAASPDAPRPRDRDQVGRPRRRPDDELRRARTPRCSADIPTTTAAAGRGHPACAATASPPSVSRPWILRASRELKVGGTREATRTMTFCVDAFNVLNRVNYGSFVGTVGSPLFGRPVSALAARQLQLSAHVKF